MTLLATTPPQSKSVLRITLHSRPDEIGPAVDQLISHAIDTGACPMGRLNKLMLAFHEALSNAVLHGNLELGSELKEHGDDCFAREMERRLADPEWAERTVTVSGRETADGFRWAITDEGPGFDIAAILERLEHEQDGPPMASGRGLALIHACVDEVNFERGGRRIVLAVHQDSAE